LNKTLVCGIIRVEMNEIGVIKSGKEIGYKDTVKRIWVKCPVCGKERWAIYRHGEYKQRCGGCTQKANGKQKLPRGEYSFKPRAVSVCKICKVEYPATGEYFKRNKQTKNGLSLGRCIRCTHRIAKSRSLSTMKGRLDRRMSNYIRMSLNGTKGFRSWESLVGYTLKDLIKHLERRFKIGMTWENYGKWHIDHVIPQSAFHYTTPDDIDFKRCWSLSNLQPLWANENVAKSDKILKPFQPSLKLENKNTKGISNIVLTHCSNNLGVLERK
jgi:hypothetical protein